MGRSGPGPVNEMSTQQQAEGNSAHTMGTEVIVVRHAVFIVVHCANTATSTGPAAPGLLEAQVREHPDGSNLVR